MIDSEECEMTGGEERISGSVALAHVIVSVGFDTAFAVNNACASFSSSSFLD